MAYKIDKPDKIDKTDKITTAIQQFITDYKATTRSDPELIKNGSLIIAQIAKFDSETIVQDFVLNIFPLRIITPTYEATLEQYANFISSIITSVNSSSDPDISKINIINLSIDEPTITDFRFSLNELTTTTTSPSGINISLTNALTDNIKTTVDILFKLVILSAMNNSEIKAKLVANNGVITLQQGRFITIGKIYCIEGVLIPPNFSDIEAMYVNKTKSSDLPSFDKSEGYTQIQNIDNLNDSLTIDNINNIYNSNKGALHFCESIIQPASPPIPVPVPVPAPVPAPAPSTGSILTQMENNTIYRNYLIKLHKSLTTLYASLTKELKTAFETNYSVLYSFIELREFEQNLQQNLPKSIRHCLQRYFKIYNQLHIQINARINNLPSTIEQWNASNNPQPFLYYKYKETSESVETKSFFEDDKKYNTFNACLLQIIANYKLEIKTPNHTIKNKQSTNRTIGGLNKTLKNYYD